MAATGRPALIGRDVVLAAADRMLEDAGAGRGRVLLVSGEAGIGKTTVAREIARRASTAGMATHWGATFDGAAMLPFAVWLHALARSDHEPCARAASRLDGLEADVDRGAEGDADSARRQRLRRFHDVVDDLRQASIDRPQMIVLEDLHWADTGSQELLAAAAASVPVMAVLLVATYRSEEFDAAGPLASVGGAAESIALERLVEPEVSQLMADILGRRPSPTEARRVHRQSGGNPLFVTQLARLPPSAATSSVPEPLRDVLARRLARTSADCDHLLGAASAIGFTFELDVLSAVIDLPVARVGDLLDEATEARLVAPVEDDPGQWQFLHDLVRVARYDALGGHQREQWHRRITDVFDAARTVPVGVLAHHASLAGLPPEDPRPATYHLDAAREAARRMAWSEAVALAERALHAAPPRELGLALRAEAWLVQGEALLRQGDHDRATDAFSAASDLGQEIDDPDLIARAALGFGAGLAGFEVRLFDHRQLDLLERAADASADDAPLRPLVLARLSVALSMLGVDDRRRALADEAIALARRVGDERALAAALAARCDAVAGPDHVVERLAAASEVVSLARRNGDRALELLGRRLRVVGLLEQRDLGAFIGETTAYERTATTLDDPFYSWYVDLWHAMRAHADGRLDEAEQLADRAAMAGTTAGSRNAELLQRVLVMWVRLDRGDASGALGLWYDVIGEDPEILDFTSAVISYIHCRTGRLGEARRLLDDLGPEILDRFAYDQEWLANVAQSAVVAARVGDRDVADRAYELLAPYEGLGVFEGIAAVDHGTADRFLALTAGCRGDAEATARHTERALAAVTGSGRLVEAHTRADCARGLLATGDDAAHERGAQLVAEAIAGYDALGLDALVDDARALLESSSVARRGDGRPSLLREGDTWAFTFEGSTVRVRHAKGVADLAMLLANPGREVHVRTLEGADDIALPMSSQPALDDEAVRRYRDRLRDLEAELDEADQHADIERSGRLVVERDALVDELTGAFGLAGRRRSAGSDPDERLRKAVSARVKSAVGRLDRLHPALARHLRSSVRTGYRCAYEPEKPVDWTVTTELRT